MKTAATFLTPTHLDVVYLLVIGATRSAISRDLYLSVRTVDQRIADLRRALRAADRFGLGVAAVWQGLIDPTYPISHARARREAPSWVAPTPRQYEILHLRGGGVTAEQVARKINLSASCVRRDLARLAIVNGARNAVSAGALFQALGWVRRPAT